MPENESRHFVHKLEFLQGSAQSRKSIILKLGDGNGGRDADELTGRWTQGTSEPAGINLYPNFTPGDKERLRWIWYRSQQLIKVGIDTPTETRGAKVTKSSFTNWFTLFNAKRLASGKFVITGETTSDDEGPASYELGGSNNTFDPKLPGYWAVMAYPW